jgi:hypothetical protein
MAQFGGPEEGLADNRGSRVVDPGTRGGMPAGIWRLSMDKFEFASPAWLAALKELLVTYSKKAGDGLELSICEIFTGVPKHLDKHGNGVIAWHCLIKDGKVHFEETAIPEADVHSQADYAFIVPVARKVYSPEVMAEVEAYMAKGTAEGKMISKSKNRWKVPPVFTGMHNELAVRTL